MPFCSSCGISVEKRRWIGHLRSNAHKNNDTEPLDDDGKIQLIKSAFRGRIVSYRIVAPEGDELYSTRLFFDNMQDRIKKLIDRSLRIHTSVKVNFELFAIFVMFKDDRQEMKSFGTKNVPIFFNYDFNELF